MGAVLCSAASLLSASVHQHQSNEMSLDTTAVSATVTTMTANLSGFFHHISC
jgi:hypothetical protein